MTPVPRGTRREVDVSLFRQQSDDPTIKPDTVTPAVEGYFRIPAVWVGDKPDDASVLKVNPSVHHAVVVDKDLSSGIKVRVQRDGTFLFDFTTWDHAPQIEIPGYRTPGPGIAHRQPSETEEAVSKSERYAVLRTQVMNVHQACMATAEQLVKHRSAEMGLPLTAADLLKGLTFEQCILYRNSHDPRSLARNALNNHPGVREQKPFARRILELEVVEFSLELLDEILLLENPTLIQMSEAAYLAGNRCAEGRLGEAVTLAWGVCEQLISTAWDRLLSEARGTGRMPGKRLKKLTERDYTVSVRTEFLEFEERIGQGLYQHLEEARRARNRWAHEMKEPDSGQVLHSIRAVEGLFNLIHGIRLSLSLTGPSPGVPEWNVWIWEAVKNNGQT